MDEDCTCGGVARIQNTVVSVQYARVWRVGKAWYSDKENRAFLARKRERCKPCFIAERCEVNHEQIILRELHKRAKLKDEARFISYRELECEPYNMNSPSSHMSRLRKKHPEIKVFDRINCSTGKDFKVFRI